MRRLPGAIAVALLSTLAACTFCPAAPDPCVLIDAPTNTEVAESSDRVVFESPSTLVVYHGTDCAKSAGSSGFPITVQRSLKLPLYATAGTVFLNGWHTLYTTSEDRHVAMVGTMINNIDLKGNTLTWQATGVLADRKHDEGFRWCYTFTALGWSSAAMDLVADHDDGRCDPQDMQDHLLANFYSSKNGTSALASHSSFLINPEFASRKKVALLPRGFGFGWAKGCNDERLLQVAYNLDHHEPFLEADKRYRKRREEPQVQATNTSRVDRSLVTWDTTSIFKDDAESKGYQFGELVSGLAGNGVDVIQPPFSIVPRQSTNTCVASNAPTTQEVVTDVPFDVAIPMLTGWELSYCEDEDVKELGIQIDDWSYEKDPAAATGTLRYQVAGVLVDDQGTRGTSRHKVAILGLNPTQSVLGRPDLVPVSPGGSEPSAFCRIEQDRKLVRVTIKNQGSAAAPGSKTTVMFGTTPVTVDTPPVAVDASVDVTVPLPSGCFAPDCGFIITVDAQTQVSETNETNNVATAFCLG